MFGQSVAESLGLALGYADRLLKGVPAAQFARFATIGEQTIEANHPAFILGHLSIYGPRIVNDLADQSDGAAGSLVKPSDEFLAVFSKDAKCQDDADGTIYPPMDSVVSAFFENYRAAQQALQAADDAKFSAVNPNELMRAKFSTLGSMHAFYCGGHLMMHLGQFSSWRRMVGLPPA